MTAAVKAELRKLLSTRLWWILLLVLVAYVGFIGAVMGFTLTLEVDGASAMGDPKDAALMTYSMANGIGYVFPLLLGTLAFTSEYRHRTIGQTLLVQPDRDVLLAAKVTATMVLGLVYGLAMVLAIVGTGGVLLQWRGDGAYLGDREIVAVLAMTVVATVVWSVVGVVLGALVTNQVVAIVSVLAFTQFLEPIARLAFSAVDAIAPVGQYLPGAAADALVGASAFGFTGGSEDLLPRWGGLLVLLGYALVLGVAARLTTLRRDVT